MHTHAPVAIKGERATMLLQLPSTVAAWSAVVLLVSAGLAPSPMAGGRGTNPFKRSAVLQKLAGEVNDHPSARWVAGTGRDNQTSRNRQRQRGRYPYYHVEGDVDWRRSALLAEPSRQGTCGSCWAFAAVHTLMDNWSIYNKGRVEKLSVQHVLECCR